MELQHFSHEHPLVFIEERSNESEKVYCSGCGQLVSGPSFSCVECGFYLDKQCAEAPSEINHPFHRNHSFNLLQRPPYSYEVTCFCDFCNQTCENFVYHCSCNLDLHIKCALLSYNIAERRIAEFQHIARIDPLISTDNRTEELKKAECFICCKPLLDSVYFSPDCGFYLHAKCVDLPVETNHLLHPQHPLILQFNDQLLSCKICQNTRSTGFVYCCSPCEFVLHIECAAIPTKINRLCHRKHPLFLQFKDDDEFPCQICQETKYKQIAYCCSICKFALHIECASPPPTIDDENHQHPFILFWRHIPFICDACGTSGNCLSYICSTCSLTVHKKCISLPHTLKHPMHYEHPIFHTYFLGQHEFESWECRLCHEDVNSEHGGYYCSHCNYIAHVNCAIEYYNLYIFDVLGTIDENSEGDSALLPYSIVKETKDGENVIATEIKHFSHQHNLVLSNDIKDDKCCDGCVLSIFTSYYYCSQCDFFLHKSCAELPRKKHLWFDPHPKLHPLTLDCIFRCRICKFETSGFAYTCDICNNHYCLRCALVSDPLICQGHEHLLPFYRNYEGLCNACGDPTNVAAFRCKRCNFALHRNCMTLPLTARHKSDEHLFFLTYHDENNYSESHYCDICEKKRNPKNWFYHCSTCDNSAHPECVLGKYSFIKLGSIYTKGDHEHPLSFVQKVHHYPECHRCGKRCFDLALECKTDGCNYIVHWECIKPRRL